MRYRTNLRGLRAAGVGLILTCLSVSSPVSAVSDVNLPEPMGNLSLPEKPAGAHWVWIIDYQWANYGRAVLYNADTAEILGMVDTGWEGAGLVWSDSKIYNASMFMSRGFRGERTDVVTTFDRHTLKPIQEVVVPPKTIRGFQDLNHFTLTDDKRFMLLQFVSPASSIGVVDVIANKYIGEIETSGCINAMPVGDRRFFSLCGDGSALAITLNEEGKEESRKRYPKLFDPDLDPLHESGVRSGDTWYFVSHLGQIHPIDVSEADFKFEKPWAVSSKDGELTWIPGQPAQTIAVHDSKQWLYVLMHASDLKPKLSGSDIHRQSGTETRVFDLKTQKLLHRIKLENPTDSISVSQDASPLLYATSGFHASFTIQDAVSGELLWKIPFPSIPTVIQPVN
jgi:methylamine dehydrogenase heavy chain